MTVYTFLPWVREGAASAIPAGSQDPLTGPLDLRVEVPVTFQVNSAPEDQVQVRLYGPGDVTGFDRRLVVRTDPPHLTPAFELNYFPTVEFDRPDFPWLFTPAAPNGQRLRPWIVLIVLRTDEAKLEPPTPRSLPVLTVSAPYRQKLPDLRESSAWAHAQISGEATQDQALKNALTGSPDLNLSRLICHRRLAPGKQYLACVVPAFKAGLQAGLGDEVPESGSLEPAWDVNDTTDTGDLRVPVYYHWEFATGEAGDFESLVWALEQRRLDPAKIGVRPLQVTSPGHGVPAAPVPGLEGALRVPGGSTPGLTGVPEPFRKALQTVLNKPGTLTVSSAAADAVVGPPIYGRWHAAEKAVLDTSRLWLQELNLDPRWRVAAAVGTQVVQERQDQLMASAWEQVGEIDRANQALRQAQLARSVGRAVYGQRPPAGSPIQPTGLSAIAAETLFQLTGPVHTRVVWGERTVGAKARESALTAAPASAAFRRIVRPNGPVARRVNGGGAQQNLDLIQGMNSSAYKGAEPLQRPRGAAIHDSIADGTGSARRLSDATPEALKQRDPRTGLQGFQKAAMAVQAAILRTVDPTLHDPAGPPALNLAEAQKALLDGLNPEKTVTERMLARLVNPDPSWRPEDPLEPIMAAPDFPAPMYRALVDLSQEWLLPGLEQVPPNTLTLVETNPRFIEAFMVGLSHEMSRELLWRGYPTDQRGTYFRQFWDPRGRVPRPASTQDAEEIGRIHEWDKASGLGSHITGGSQQALMVLLIRGELLSRYPNATIYAVQGEWSQVNGQPAKPRQPVAAPGSGQQKYPVFRGSLAPDIAFLGFDLGRGAARGDQTPANGAPGWFFVIEQQPTEPRFGLDETPPTSGAQPTWRDLSWQDVFVSGSGYIDLSKGLKSSFQKPTAPVGIDWGSASHSAAVAYIALQRPFRIAVHASDLLPV